MWANIFYWFLNQLMQFTPGIMLFNGLAHSEFSLDLSLRHKHFTQGSCTQNEAMYVAVSLI